MTKKEKQQLKKDIKDGKVDMDELYEKYDYIVRILWIMKLIKKSMAIWLSKNITKKYLIVK